MERPAEMRSPGQPVRFGLAFALSLLTLLVLLSSSWDDAPSWDEPMHVTGGYTNLGFGVNFVGTAHPPLTQDLSALAVRALMDTPPLESWRTYRADLCMRELWSGRLDPQTLIRTARLPIIVLSSLFAGLMLLTVGQRHGTAAGLIAAGMLALSPNFLAHASLVNTDVAAAAMIYLSLWFLAGYLAEPTLRRLLAFALVAATAQIAKFSCLIVYPVYLVAITVSSARWRHWKRAPLVILVFVGLIWSVYVAHPTGPRLAEAFLQARVGGTDTPAARFLKQTYRRRLIRPLGWYLTGVLGQGRHVAKGHDYAPYLAGKLRPGGTRWYFPILLVVKVPLGITVLVLLGLSVRRRLSAEEGLYAGFSLLYLGIAVLSPLNLGIRHILPIFPCVFALTGARLGPVWESSGSARRRLAIGMAFACAAVSCLLTYPRFLSYFNVLAGGRVLAVDSNFDWGTDLYRLSRRAASQGWKPLTIDYFGSISPAVYLGPDSMVFDPEAPPASGYFAASMSKYLPLLAWMESTEIEPEKAAEKELLRGFVRRLEKVETVGSILVFRILPAPASQDAQGGP